MTTTPAPAPNTQTAGRALAAMAEAHTLTREALNAALHHDVATVTNLLLQLEGSIENAEQALCALKPEEA